MVKHEKIVAVGVYCKNFRTNELGMTLKQFSEYAGTNLKTTSSFEHGNSTNIIHMFNYLGACPNDELRMKFLKGLNELLGDM